MVTASHNPPRDNGYKVYLGDGSQIVPPADVEIAARIDAGGRRRASVARADAGWTVLGEEVVDAYLDAVVSVVAPETPRELSVVHTAMHGVGGEIVLRAFERAGFPPPIVVEEQAAPDPDFPTVPFPNPEEPGAIDLALAVARRVRPDVVIASDPDADRCAVAVPDPAAATAADPDGWRMLRGDEVGVLLGAHVPRPRGRPGRAARGPRPLDRLVAAARRDGRGRRRARRRDAHRLQVDRPRAAPPLRLRGGDRLLRRPGQRRRQGRDLGGAADRRHGRRLRAQGRTLLDVLDDLARAHGSTRPTPSRCGWTDLALIGVLMARLRAAPATEIGGVAGGPRSTTSPRAPAPASPRPRASATSWPTPRGSSCGRQRHGAEAQDLPRGDRPPERRRSRRPVRRLPAGSPARRAAMEALTGA